MYPLKRPTSRWRPSKQELAQDLLAAASDPISWPDLAKAIGRSPKDGTARRLRDDLLEANELVKLDDGRLQVPTGVAPSESCTGKRKRSRVPKGAGPPNGASTVAPSDPKCPGSGLNLSPPAVPALDAAVRRVSAAYERLFRRPTGREQSHRELWKEREDAIDAAYASSDADALNRAISESELFRDGDDPRSGEPSVNRHDIYVLTPSPEDKFWLDGPKLAG